MPNKLSVFIVLIAISCGHGSNSENNSEPVISDSIAIINDPKNNLNIQTSTFFEIDTSGILIFPLSMAETERSGGSLYYKSIPDSKYWNIIFFNSKTNEYHLLSDKKMLIRNYDFKYTSDDNIEVSQTRKNIFYVITIDDYNKDRKLTDEDPEYLFISNKEGNNLRRISPLNYQLRSWQFIKSTNKVLMTAVKDSDNNHKFDNTDEVMAFEIDPEKETEPREILSKEFKNNLKILFDRDWKRLKE